MAELPPPSTPSDPHDVAAERAARLERLARRTQGATDATPTAPRAARRRHPARGARAAAFGMSLATTAGLAGVFATMARPATAETAAVVVTGAGSPAAAGSPVPAAVASGPTVVDGAVFRNKWGPVQVEATFASDGTLTDVVALQTPDDRGQSVRINDYAVPRLNSDALTAQTASVDTVSGATYTSVGYRQSLQSAIDAARAAGVTAIA